MSRPKGLDFLNLMEQQGIHTNHQTYVWLLEGCLESGSLVDAKKLHGRILKFGFDGEHVISSQLLDVYATHGNFEDAVQLFDDFSHRRCSTSPE
ncbi:hypothetical protein U1Q18_023681 [Sarracenia purpurea var. burkii]